MADLALLAVASAAVVVVAEVVFRGALLQPLVPRDEAEFEELISCRWSRRIAAVKATRADTGEPHEEAGIERYPEAFQIETGQQLRPVGSRHVRALGARDEWGVVSDRAPRPHR